LDQRGTILDVARQLSALLKRENVRGAVIGGIAVVLHGYVRTTLDIDLFLDEPPARMAEVLNAEGYDFDEQRREFVRDGVPVHFVTREQVGKTPARMIVIDGVVTVSLADLIEMKLESGSKNILRAKDMADVVGLIRCHGLRGDFARHLDRSLRPIYRKLVKAIEQEGRA
jgi:Nucleotidyltransferase of unknown function (DUF6036)